MFKLLHPLVDAIQPYLVPLCFFLTWGFIILLFLTVWSAARTTFATAKRMHHIPCSGCEFFVNDHRLKCTVNPSIANTEVAIHCSDYCSKTNPYSAT